MKVASGPWAGLEVELLDASKVPLPEYPREDIKPENARVSKHVACTHGERFSIQVIRPDDHAEAVEVSIAVDGRKIDYCLMPPHCRCIDIAHVNDRQCTEGMHVHGHSCNAAVVSTSLKFGKHEFQDGGGPVAWDPRLYEHLGTITITLRAGKRERIIHTPRRSFTAEHLGLGPKSKKHRGAPTARYWSKFFHDPSVPTLTVSFVYRSEERLKEMRVILPEGDEETELEDLTPKMEDATPVSDEEDESTIAGSQESDTTYNESAIAGTTVSDSAIVNTGCKAFLVSLKRKAVEGRQALAKKPRASSVA